MKRLFHIAAKYLLAAWRSVLLGNSLLFSELLKEICYRSCDQNPELPILEMVLTLIKHVSRRHVWCLETRTAANTFQIPWANHTQIFQLLVSLSPLLLFNPSPFQSTHHVTFLGTSKGGIIKRTEERVWTEYTWKRCKLQLRLVHAPYRQNLWGD